MISKGLGRSREVSGVHARYLIIFEKKNYFLKNLCIFYSLLKYNFFSKIFIFQKYYSKCSLKVSGGLGRSRKVSGGLGGTFKVFANLCENKIFFQKFLFFKNMIPNAL